MIFGLLFLDILLWIVAPFVLLCLLWGDKKAWAFTLTLGVGAVLLFSNGFGATFALFTDPVWLSTALRNVAIYAGIGFSFSFLKWWVLTRKSANQFREYLTKRTFKVDTEKVAEDVRRSRARGGVDHFGGTEEEAIEKAKEQTLQEMRAKVASDWNSSYDNHYRKVLSIAAKNPTGWDTSYKKWTLSEYVTSWTIWWPLYAALLVLDDLIRHIIDWFVEVFGKGFQKIANASFSNIE